MIMGDAQSTTPLGTDHVIKVSDNAFITIEPPSTAVPGAILRMTTFIGGSGMILNLDATAARELLCALAETLGMQDTSYTCDGASEPHSGHVCLGVGEWS